MSLQDYELSHMTQRFANILNHRQPTRKKRRQVGYVTGGQKSGTVPAKKTKLSSLAFGSLHIQDSVMGDENINHEDSVK
jgi:hypothetical protein